MFDTAAECDELRCSAIDNEHESKNVVGSGCHVALRCAVCGGFDPATVGHKSVILTSFETFGDEISDYTLT